jgi:pectinesterase
MKKVFLILLVVSKVGFAQNNVVIDSSYTIKKVFDKLINEYPSIRTIAFKKDSNVIQKNEIVYQTKENRALHLDVFFDTTKKINPTVIMIHGGGWKSGNKEQMQVLAQEIASKGYSCFAIEYRLSPEALYPAAIFDVKNAIKFIKDNAKNFHVDVNKIAILGCSSGGQMAALIGTTNGNLDFEDTENGSESGSDVQAIIDIDGVLAFKHPESKEGAIASFWLNGNYEENPKNWRNASALTHTNQDTPPILFINSSHDRFHAGRDDMIAILNKYNIYNEVKTIPNTPHSFWFFDPWFSETTTYITQFLAIIFK